MICSTSQEILIAGNWHWDIYEDALSRGFKSQGWNVIPFKTDDYLPNNSCNYLVRARFAPILYKLNAALLRMFEIYFPNVVFFNRSDLILPSTLKKIKRIKPETILVIYHNDNPFISFMNKFKMRHYLNSISIADVTLVYRPSDIENAIKYGAKRVELFRPYYLSYRHRPLYSPILNGKLDVIYIGHFEPDGRAEMLNYLTENGVKVQVFGTRWETPQKKYKWLAEMDIRQVWGDEYSALISAAKIALVFYSKKNRDVYTRRCFEIPACGTMMVAPRNYAMEKLFRDGEEAVYYSSREELLKKIRYYLDHKNERLHIAQAGRTRCLKDGHDEIARVRRIIEIIAEIKKSG